MSQAPASARSGYTSARVCAAVLLQLLLLSSACASASTRHLRSSARKLSEEAHDDHDDHHMEFVELLGSEPPLQHISDMYVDSGTSEDAVTWLVHATREGCSSAAAVEEDPHAGHDHRRLQQVDDDHDDHDHEVEEHAEDEHDDHDHAAEKEHADHDDHDDHAGHDDHEHAGHDDHGEPSVLETASLVRATANLTGNAAKLEMAMGYILACQADTSCTLEEEVEEEAGEESMDKLWGLKIGLAFAFLAITIVTTYIPLMFKHSETYSGILGLLNVATGAIFLTVGIVHLLPEVVEFEALAGLSTDFPVGFAMVVIGFTLVLFVEHVVFAGHDHSHGCSSAEHYLDECEAGTKDKGVTLKGIWKDIMGRYRGPMIMQLAILVHATLESIAVGLATPRRDALLLFAAIAAHKPFDSMAIATRLFKRGCPFWLVNVLLLPIYIVPFIGVMIGTVIVGEDYTTLLILNGLTVGGFIYVGGFEVLCEEFTHEAHVRQELEIVRKQLQDTKVDAEDVPALARDPKNSAEKPWHPSNALKFLAFLLGVGIILLFSAVLPGHVH